MSTECSFVYKVEADTTAIVFQCVQYLRSPSTVPDPREVHDCCTPGCSGAALDPY